jgi:NTE family protein
MTTARGREGNAMVSPVKRNGNGNGNGGPKAARSNKKRINLALQGGGAHGAFAWGVIDRLLEEDEIEIDGIVGTSAGAMNAAATAYGIALGGNAGARGAALGKADEPQERQPRALAGLHHDGLHVPDVLAL